MRAAAAAGIAVACLMAVAGCDAGGAVNPTGAAPSSAGGTARPSSAAPRVATAAGWVDAHDGSPQELSDAMAMLPRATNTGNPVGGSPGSLHVSLARAAAVVEARVVGLTADSRGIVRLEVDVLSSLRGGVPVGRTQLLMRTTVSLLSGTPVLSSVDGSTIPEAGRRVVLVLDRIEGALTLQIGCGVYAVADDGALTPSSTNRFADDVRGLTLTRLATLAATG